MIQVAITTHNRPKWCLDLLTQISKYKKVHVAVFHDKCGNEYREVQKFCKRKNWHYFRTYTNFGKWDFWQLHNYIYEYLENRNFKYYVQLTDDMTLVDNFFERAIRSLESRISCNNIYTAKVHHDRWFREKTKVNGIELFTPGRIDCAFVTTKYVMSGFRLSEPEEAIRRLKTKGSGVGHAQTEAYYKKHPDGKIMWHYYSLLWHRGSSHRSVMHLFQNKNGKNIRDNEIFQDVIADGDLKYLNSLNLKDDLFSYLKGKSVAFVALAPHLQGKGLGKVIDNHDLVYRTNYYPIAEHLQKDYGKRCDILSFLKRFNKRVKVPYLVHYEASEYMSGSEYYFVTPELRKKMRQFIIDEIGADPMNPTSGLIAIFLCLMAGAKVKLYGVTGYQDKNGNVVNHGVVEHYIDDWLKIASTKERLDNIDMENYRFHNFTVQNKYIRKLLSEGKIEIDEYSAEYFKKKNIVMLSVGDYAGSGYTRLKVSENND